MTIIFTDGDIGSTQETLNNFTAWTGTFGTTAVEGTHPVKGLFDFKYTALAAASSYSHKTIVGTPVAYAGVYFQTTHVPVINGSEMPIILLFADATHYAQAGIRFSGADAYWFVGYAQGGGISKNNEAVPSNPQNNTEYFIQIVRDLTNGKIIMWADGVKKIDLTVAQTVNTVAAYLGAGCLRPTDEATIVFADWYVVSDNYISEALGLNKGSTSWWSQLFG